MRNSIKKAIGTTVQDMIEAGFISSFTQKEFDALGLKIPEIVITSTKIKAIRKKRNLSQTVFAKLLNVSPSSVR
ncbi:helix-turn-helix domain-containing protein [Desulfobacterales bacterium HSG17]|nr:helix-turn-helix domain-containing protein [Desulfobacterales bacterium HSG17]